MEALVQELAGVDRETAIKTLLETKGDPVLAVDRLLEKPLVKGDAYIPAKPVVDTGLSEEQKALCQRGRWLQDKVNVVFSVAHSKIRNQPSQDLSEHEASEQPGCLDSSLQQTVELEQLQDVLSQTTQGVSQS
jgi:hypothetical protein